MPEVKEEVKAKPFTKTNKVKNVTKKTLYLSKGAIKEGATGSATLAECATLGDRLERV